VSETKRPDNPSAQQRTSERFDYRLTVQVVHAGLTVTSQTRNISLGGCFVETEAEVPFGGEVTVELELPTARVAIKGLVRWVEKSQGRVTGLGLQFAALQPKDVWALNKLFETKPA
jgi:uncharacterized protein (TIGR02266 family)